MPYNGVLYAGLMITDDGPKLIEYNVRFGDPECQPMMARLKSDALEILLACAEGWLDEIELEWHKDAALTVVLAAEGYPGAYMTGSEIRGLEAATEEGVLVFGAVVLLKPEEAVASLVLHGFPHESNVGVVAIGTCLGTPGPECGPRGRTGVRG